MQRQNIVYHLHLLITLDMLENSPDKLIVVNPCLIIVLRACPTPANVQLFASKLCIQWRYHALIWQETDSLKGSFLYEWHPLYFVIMSYIHLFSAKALSCVLYALWRIVLSDTHTHVEMDFDNCFLWLQVIIHSEIINDFV